MEHVLVTGGLGFIGHHLCHALAIMGYDVVNIDKESYAVLPETLHSLGDLARRGYGYRYVRGHLEDTELVQNVLAQHKPTKIYHLAAESHVDRSIMFPDDFISSNVLGTYRLLEAYRRFMDGVADRSRYRFVYCSTDEVYGSLDIGDASFSDQSATRPTSPYAASKAAGDALCCAWEHTYGLPIITTHCTNNYGPGQFPEKLIPRIITALLEDEPIPVHGSGKQVRDWLYVMDHVRGLMLAADRGDSGKVYNFSAGNERTNLEIIKLVVAEVAHRLNSLKDVPIDRLIEYVHLRPTDDLRYSLDNATAREELGWEPSMTLERGLEETVNSYFRGV